MSKQRQTNNTTLSLSQVFKRSVILLTCLLLLIQAWYFIQVCWFNIYPPQTTSMMNQQQAVIAEKYPKRRIQQHWLEIEKISPNLQRAVITAEDSKFMTHHGFDWDGIKLAYEKNIKRGKIVAGGSTISQQLAKNLFLSASKTPWRKLQEAVITMMIESIMSKQRILELYLNVVEWGNGVFGAQAAAKHYFGSSATNLSRQQAAQLASMLPNPRYYDVHRQTGYLTTKTNRILRNMHMTAIPKP